MKVSRMLGAFAALFLISSGTPAVAALITFNYEGAINQTTGGAAFTAFDGKPVTFSFTFDSTTADSNPGDSTSGNYLAAITAVTVTIDANTYTGTAGFIGVTDSASEDKYVAWPSFSSGPDIGGLSFANGTMILTDSTLTAFASDALPLVQPDPADFDTQEFVFEFNDGGANTGSLTASGNLSISAVPLPAAVWLFGSGMLGLVGMARRKKA